MGIMPNLGASSRTLQTTTLQPETLQSVGNLWEPPGRWEQSLGAGFGWWNSSARVENALNCAQVPSPARAHPNANICSPHSCTAQSSGRIGPQAELLTPDKNLKVRCENQEECIFHADSANLCMVNVEAANTFLQRDWGVGLKGHKWEAFPYTLRSWADSESIPHPLSLLFLK